MVTILAIFVLAAHLICVNLAAGAPLVCFGFEFAARRGSAAAMELTKKLAWHAIAALLAGSLLGVWLGWLLWDERFTNSLHRLNSKITMGVYELIFSLGLLLAYGLFAKHDRRAGLMRFAAQSLALLLAGTNLLYHFPLLFIIVSQETRHVTTEFATINSAAFRQLIMRGDVLAQATHFWLATFAVTGVWLAFIAGKKSECPQDYRTDDADQPAPESGTDPTVTNGNRSSAVRIGVWGARLALVPTMLQIVVGIWLYSKQSSMFQSQLLGGDLVLTTLFGSSVALALWLMHCLAAMSTGEDRHHLRKLAIGLTVAIVTLMTGVLIIGRNA